MTDAFRLDNETAVVTGACGKLGPIWVEALLEAGARVAALDLPGVNPSVAFTALGRSHADRLRRFDCDITDRGSIEAATGALTDQLGVPAVLVNNAGVDQPADSSGSRSTIDGLPIEQFRRMVEVNLLGTFQMTQVVGARMASRRHPGGQYRVGAPRDAVTRPAR